MTYSELRPHSCFQQVLTSVVGPMAAKRSLAQEVARLHFVHQSLWLVWSFSLQAGGPLFPAVQTAETSSQPAGRVAVRFCDRRLGRVCSVPFRFWWTPNPKNGGPNRLLPQGSAPPTNHGLTCFALGLVSFFHFPFYSVR